MNRLEAAYRSENSPFPILSLPAERVSAWVVETDPAETQAWLSTLPLTDSVQTAQQLYQALFTLNRMALDSDDRLLLMELYRKPVAAVSAGLQTHFARLALPLKPRLKQLADFLCQLHMEMAYGYKHVVRAGLSARKPYESEVFLFAMERAIRYLGEVLLRSYQIYTPAPVGVWKEIHSYYRYTELHNCATDLFAIEGVEEGATITGSYLQTLMLALCGPYQLPQNECLQVNAFLNRWAHKASIGPVKLSTDPVGHFLIDFDSDHPAAPFPRDVPLHAAPNLRSLNAVELARVVHDFSKQLQKGVAPNTLGLGFECIGTSCSDTLKRMLRFWGLAGPRQFSRRRSQQPLALCVGLNAVHFFASGQQPFTLSQIHAGTIDNAASVPDRAELEAEQREERSVIAPLPELFRIDSRWQVRDESAAGLSLTRSGDLGVPIRVGDLLGIQNSVLQQWRIGVVRWVKSADAQHVEMGVEMLAPRVIAVAVRPAGVKDAAFTQALLLPSIEVLHQPASLLLARGSSLPGEDLELVEGDQDARRVRILNTLERSAGFAQVVFADVAARTE